MARLGVDISRVGMLRRTDKAAHPSPVTAAVLAELGGADGIVCTLDDALKHITENDVRLLREMVKTHLNLQIPLSEQWVTLALANHPDMITLIPGKKPGSTPGGGLDVLGLGEALSRIIHEIRSQSIIISVLVEPSIHQIKAAAKLAVDYVELHMGGYASVDDLNEKADQLENVRSVVLAATKLDLGVSASRGLNYQNVSEIAAIPKIEEINIGHAVVARSIYHGFENAVRDMIALVH